MGLGGGQEIGRGVSEVLVAARASATTFPSPQPPRGNQSMYLSPSLRTICAICCSGVVAATPSIAEAATRHVTDSGRGSACTQSRPCSLSTAVSDASAGDTIRVHSGIYTAAVEIRKSGQPESPIIIEGVAGAVITSPNRNSNGAFTFQWGASHWIVRNLTFDGLGQNTARSAIHINPGSSDIQIIGNTVRDWGGHENLYLWPGGVRLQAFNGVIDNIVIKGNTMIGVRGPAVHVTRMSTNVIIEDNDISESRCAKVNFDPSAPSPVIRYRKEGIKIGGTNPAANTSVVIRNNKVHDFAPASNCQSGLHDSNGIYCDVGATHGLIAGNHVYNIRGGRSSSGIHVESRCHNWKVVNNLASNIKEGVRLRNTNNSSVINNTIHDVDIGLFMVGNSNGAQTNAVIRNNIFSDINDVGIKVQGPNAEQGRNIYDHNLFHLPSKTAGIGLWGNTRYSKLQLTAWRNACACDENSLLEDPRLNVTNASISEGFHLTAESAAIDAGTGADAPGSDFDGEARPQGKAYDIGAFEYGGTSSTRPPVAPTGLTVSSR
ncbi:MAG: choice-of-anchor Q domain-containing protein [Gammaproteobacteria bacterium]